MHAYKDLLIRFVDLNKSILGNNLAGVYQYGSFVMDCFNPRESDLDLLIVVENVIPDDIKKKYMDMVVRLNEEAPAKGFELSIISALKEYACGNPSQYNMELAVEYAEYMLREIQNNK